MRIRIQVPAPQIGRVLNDDDNAVRNLIYELKTGSLREAQRTECEMRSSTGFIGR